MKLPDSMQMIRRSICKFNSMILESCITMPQPMHVPIIDFNGEMMTLVKGMQNFMLQYDKR